VYNFICTSHKIILGAILPRTDSMLIILGPTCREQVTRSARRSHVPARSLVRLSGQ